MSAFIQRKCDWGIKKHYRDCWGIFKFLVICEEHPGGSQNFFTILKLFYVVLGLYMEHQNCQCFKL